MDQEHEIIQLETSKKPNLLFPMCNNIKEIYEKDMFSDLTLFGKDTNEEELEDSHVLRG